MIFVCGTEPEFHESRALDGTEGMDPSEVVDTKSSATLESDA